MDKFISHFDHALRTCFSVHRSTRACPELAENSRNLDTKDKLLSSGLMRVNHAGEVAAQALYQSQQLTARHSHLQQTLKQAGEEELDHLAWTKQRLDELGGRPSLLNPIWYGGAFALGLLAGKISDTANLSFLRATEEKVSQHLDSHLTLLPEHDLRSRSIVNAMRKEEAKHAESAKHAGGKPLVKPFSFVMDFYAKTMTTLAQKI
ncbi:MAG: hypothetical protein RLZZ502_315 [Pseudomonadota bacterium]